MANFLIKSASCSCIDSPKSKNDLHKREKGSVLYGRRSQQVTCGLKASHSYKEVELTRKGIFSVNQEQISLHKAKLAKTAIRSLLSTASGYIESYLSVVHCVQALRILAGFPCDYSLHPFGDQKKSLRLFSLLLNLAP